MPEIEKDLFNIPDVEVFSAGTWNGDAYTEEDIDLMVKAFNETKEQIKPYLKLGHDEKQELLQKDGLPAAGWISNLKRVGKKLVADFTDIPDKIYQLIKNKAYRKVSSEVYWNLEVNNKKYPKLLSAVSLLGANMPAVQNLNDILSLYGLGNYDNLKAYSTSSESILKTYNIEGEKIMTDKVINDEKKTNEILEKKIENPNEKLDILKAEYEKKLNDKDEEIKKLNEYKLKVENEKKELERNTFVDSLDISPAMREYVKELLYEKKEYTVKKKTYTKMELIKEIFSLKDSLDVNLEESSEEGKKSENTEEQLLEKIEKYAEKHKVKYSDAYKAIVGAVAPSEEE